jgi:hypothetical protein
LAEVGGGLLQDLSHLNRDLSKVIILDTNPDCVSLQPENAIILPKWKGDVNDKGLIALLPLLECKFPSSPLRHLRSGSRRLIWCLYDRPCEPELY